MGSRARCPRGLAAAGGGTARGGGDGGGGGACSCGADCARSASSSTTVNGCSAAALMEREPCSEARPPHARTLGPRYVARISTAVRNLSGPQASLALGSPASPPRQLGSTQVQPKWHARVDTVPTMYGGRPSSRCGGPPRGGAAVPCDRCASTVWAGCRQHDIDARAVRPKMCAAPAGSVAVGYGMQSDAQRPGHKMERQQAAPANVPHKNVCRTALFHQSTALALV